MSITDFSFEQLREEIFNNVLESLKPQSYSDIHSALHSGFDPRQLVMPRPVDAYLAHQYGLLSLQFRIPHEFPLSLTIMLTMGRLGYSIQVHDQISKRASLKTKFQELALELGLRCDTRDVARMTRFEYCNEPSLVWSNTTIDILTSRQLEYAFKEFVGLQVDRMIIGIANILAAAGMLYKVPDNQFALCMIRRSVNESAMETALEEHFRIVARDVRDPKNKIYGLTTLAAPSVHPVQFYREVEASLKAKGHEVSIRHIIQHMQASELPTS